MKCINYDALAASAPQDRLAAMQAARRITRPWER